MNLRLLVGVFTFCTVSSAIFAAKDDPQSLFDGKSLAGWTGNDKLWRVDEGAITGEISAGATLDRNEFLFWKGKVADFELSLEFKIEGGKDANSGIQFRS